jgi:peptidyl-tRNA hydrolase
VTDPRDQVPQYALPLVIRVERAAPPHRTDALEAAARAVLIFLSDPRVTGEKGEGAEPDGAEGDTSGEWADAVRAWTDGRIRKVVRRARGAAWRRASELPGITVTHGTAEIRVYPPVPVDGWSADLAKLQVAGTELEDPETPPDPPNGLPVLYLNPHLPMTAGKAMAQVGHAAQLAWLAADATTRSEWKGSGFALAVRTASPAQWTELLASGLPAVRDAGFTEVAPGSCTVVTQLPVRGDDPPGPPNARPMAKGAILSGARPRCAAHGADGQDGER